MGEDSPENAAFVTPVLPPVTVVSELDASSNLDPPSTGKQLSVVDRPLSTMNPLENAFADHMPGHANAAGNGAVTTTQSPDNLLFGLDDFGESALTTMLKNRFGHDRFRKGQLQVLQALFTGR